jgi:hypothetical protein
MDMGEITRQELDAKMDAIRAWGDARFAEQRAYMDTRFAKTDVQLVELRSEMNARFAKTDVQLVELRSEMNARFGEVEVQLVDLRSQMSARFGKVDQQFKDLRADLAIRFAEQSIKLEKQLHAMTRWLIGTVIALFALTITIMAIMLNVTVSVVKATGFEADTTATSQAHVAPARSLHRFQRHHQPGAAGRDAGRHELHAGVAQVFHPE